MTKLSTNLPLITRSHVSALGSGPTTKQAHLPWVLWFCSPRILMRFIGISTWVGCVKTAMYARDHSFKCLKKLLCPFTSYIKHTSCRVKGIDRRGG